MRYVEVLPKTYNAEDRALYDAINNLRIKQMVLTPVREVVCTLLKDF